MKATLILENGIEFHGESIGSTDEVICEMVFNTSMVGYQEILTDPSYAGQGIVMTYPLIGNYGVNEEDDESAHPWTRALVVRHLAPRGSNFRCTSTLNDYLIRNGITGIQDIDTRYLTRILRKEGVMNGAITCEENFDKAALLEKLHAYKVESAVEQVTCKEIQHIPGREGKVALYDFGEKRNMVSRLTHYGCDVTIYPAHTPAEEVLKGGYDAIMLSNGPGDPADCEQIIGEVRKLYDSGMPIFGVCLGHQLMALATGAKTYKMGFGHRGGNHPVKDVARGRCFITSQNHGYVVDAGSVDPAVATVSHVNVNDGSVEGLLYLQKPVFTVQFHPEASPGPVDTDYLFADFMALIRKSKEEK